MWQTGVAVTLIPPFNLPPSPRCSHIMSTPHLHDSSSQNGAVARSASRSSLDADIALMNKLLSEDVDESDPSIEELLKRLEAAEGLADGVEERLDVVIGSLDELLNDLEATQGEDGKGAESQKDGVQVGAMAKTNSSAVGRETAGEP
ncbi:hypothetical protein BD310DRAFT_927739 [Dichomitus squalens]|uniref:Uncharacterized protein n=2 Tax=Dichomitus squalens TaxID=114155 RepID=A0A4Q9PUI9_9APHY|nr:hypothetical protein BD310DRAFT_927739 [Dichomitus squalens]